jgi:hypothetical protein
VKKYLFWSAILILSGFSCPSFEFHGDERFQVVGNVFQSDNGSIDNIEVRLTGVYDIGDEGYLQSARTDNMGNFDFVHSGSNSAYFILYLNPQRHNGISFTEYNPEYATKRIIFTKDQYKDYYLNLDSVCLLEKGIPVRLLCKDGTTDKLQHIRINSAKSDFSFNPSVDVTFHNLMSFSCKNDVILYFPAEDTLYMRYENTLDTLILGDSKVDYILR